MKREERKVLDLRKGYTIDEVEELRNGRLIKMSSIELQGPQEGQDEENDHYGIGIRYRRCVGSAQPGVQRGQSGGAEHR